MTRAPGPMRAQNPDSIATLPGQMQRLGRELRAQCTSRHRINVKVTELARLIEGARRVGLWVIYV